MASPLTHAATGLALGTVFWRKGDTKRFWIAGAICASLADVDAFGVLFGIPYESAAWGHRGFTHSLTFALLLALLVAWKGFDAERRRRMGLYLFLAAASHGLLDAMTTEGLGVAFFAPFWNERFFLPCRPILITPLNPAELLGVHVHGARLLMVRGGELRTVWPALAALTGITGLVRLFHARRTLQRMQG